MPIKIHPKVGQVLLCDFSRGFAEPEMVKSGRPVLVLASQRRGPNLCTVVALSTREPDQIEPWHMKVPDKFLPMTPQFAGKPSWVKADMIYTVGFHRLDLILLPGKDPVTGKRRYFSNKLGPENMKSVRTCVLNAMNIGHVATYL